MKQAADYTETDAPPTSVPTFIVSLLEGAVNSFEMDRPASRAYLIRAVSLIRAQVKESIESTGGPARGRLASWQVNRVIGYIEANLSTPLKAIELAVLVNLSVSHLFRAFKVSVGVTPCGYITHRRVERARELMATTNESLAQVALDCGLNDQSSCCRVFRRIVGQSPSEWRRANALGPQGGNLRVHCKIPLGIGSAGSTRTCC